MLNPLLLRGVAWSSLALLFGVVWGGGAWWVLTTHMQTVREQRQLAQQEAYASSLRRVQRLAKKLNAAVDSRAAQWLDETESAVLLLEAIEQTANEAGLQWETKSAEEQKQTDREPPRIIFTGAVEGSLQEILRFLRGIEGLEGEPHLVAVALDRKDEEARWRGSLKLEAFRVPRKGEQEGPQSSAAEELGDPRLHP